jgi:GT2 family glycosyltransferase
MRLPEAPRLDDLERYIPRIGPVTNGASRPFWSVMIPTYNSGEYLRRTLASVLSQDPGPEQMQIEVVDGCSTKDDPERMVRELGGDRVTFHRLPSNQGGPHTFNVCIERARGQWVHTLHGDDMVLPGFYAAYEAMIRSHPEVVMVMGKVVTIDHADRWLYLSPAGPTTDGPLMADFARRQAVEQQGAFPTVVVKRAAYEQVGGFCTWFKHCADMDMWFRVGLAGPVARVPAAYALFRKHPASDTNAHTVSAANIREHVVSKLINIARLREVGVDVTSSGWRRQMADYAEEWGWRLDAEGALDGRLNQARWAWKLHPTPHRFWFLTKSALKKALLKRPSGLSSPAGVC